MKNIHLNKSFKLKVTKNLIFGGRMEKDPQLGCQTLVCFQGSMTCADVALETSKKIVKQASVCFAILTFNRRTSRKPLETEVLIPTMTG